MGKASLIMQWTDVWFIDPEWWNDKSIILVNIG